MSSRIYKNIFDSHSSKTEMLDTYIYIEEGKLSF